MNVIKKLIPVCWMMKKSKRSDSCLLGYLDLLFITLIMFVFMFAVAFAQIEPETKKAEIKTKAEYVMLMSWPEEDGNDIDIWVLDPTGSFTSYKDKDSGLVHLDRDDLGHKNDSVVLPDGTVVKYEHNQEILTIRGCIPGEWVINTHLYRQSQKGPSYVRFRLDKLNPSVVTMLNEVIVLEEYWQEETVIRFTMNSKCEMLDRDTHFFSIISKHPEAATTQPSDASGTRRTISRGGGS